MGDKLKGYEKAGRVIRLFGWIGLVASIAIAAAVAIPSMASGKTAQGLLVGGAILAIVGCFAWFQLFLGQSIKEHKDWARTVGIVLSVLQLFGFPIGTLVGGYVLWQLIKGWDEPPAQTP